MATNAERALKAIISIVAVGMSAYHLTVAFIGAPQALFFRSTHLLFALTLIFLLYPGFRRREGARASWPELIWIAIAVGTTLYIWVNHDYLLTRFVFVDDPTQLELVLGFAFTLLVLEATRRVIGWPLPATAVVFLFYALFIAKSRPEQIIEILYLTTEGIFGPTLGVSAAYVIMFVLFGAFMERTGIGQLFMDFALSLTGHTAGGPGKVAVVSSSLFGTVSGSAVANVLVDGPITIPLMKRTGFKPAFAAAVESVASTGGQIMPPIMGAAAFVMAEFLAVSYFQVAVWAFIPAVLYYLAVFSAVHFESKRVGLLGLPRSEIPRFGTVMRERGHLFIPLLTILFGLMAGYSAPLCALAGTLTCIPVALMRKTTRKGIGWRTVWSAMEEGAKNAIAVALACACAGIVIGVITLTGAAINFTALVVNLSQDLLVLALILTMLAGIILGMGMPTTPAYIVMVSLLVPAIIKLGAIPPAAHMFAFYFAILSAITPPVALAVYAAAGLAKANLWDAGLTAVRVGAAGFIVPFMFIFEPSLLMIGEWTGILQSFATAAIGTVCLAAGLFGYFLGIARVWERVFLVGAAVLLIKPGLVTDLAGAALFISVLGSQMLRRRTEAESPRSATR
ncbi:MAG: C4-dicarboxylate ABC transporter permease [Betaproteobacteria bacterium SG8_41]|nr:MAG: C4-dicarboxylate ABC transporter permease [Betaproteobacteria bacterium SG8_41]